MASWTTKATTQSKTSGSTLATSALSCEIDSLMLVALGYDDALGHPSDVKWGNRVLALRPPPATRNPGTYDIAMSVWLLNRVKRSTSHVITATWAGSIDERAMVVGQVTGDRNRVDQATGNNDGTTTTDPTTGLTGTLAAADDFAVCVFIAEGPDTNDTPGTMQIKDGGTWKNVTGTARIGTNGPPPASNVTINVGWLQLTSAQATEARITGATSRLWTSAIITLKRSLDEKQGLSPSDINQVTEIFEDHTPPLNPEDAAFVYDPATDTQEVYHRSDMTTRIASRNPLTVLWTAD